MRGIQDEDPEALSKLYDRYNGIIKALPINIDSTVDEGAILAELDKEQLQAQVRGAEANLLAARAALTGAQAQLKKNV